MQKFVSPDSLDYSSYAKMQRGENYGEEDLRGLQTIEKAAAHYGS